MSEFLLARIEADEAAARRAVARSEGDLWVVTGADNAVGVDYDPARVLAECAARRRIVELHKNTGIDHCEVCADDGPWYDRGMLAYPCPTLLALAQPYAGEPGWRDEWALP